MAVASAALGDAAMKRIRVHFDQFEQDEGFSGFTFNLQRLLQQVELEIRLLCCQQSVRFEEIEQSEQQRALVEAQLATQQQVMNDMADQSQLLLANMQKQKAQFAQHLQLMEMRFTTELVSQRAQLEEFYEQQLMQQATFWKQSHAGKLQTALHVQQEEMEQFKQRMQHNTSQEMEFARYQLRAEQLGSISRGGSNRIKCISRYRNP